MKELKPLVIKLQGNKRFIRLLESPAQTKSLRSGYVNLKPGQDVGEHITEAKEEIIIVFNGRAEISCQNQLSLTAGKNSVVYIPPETKHNVKNIGRQILRYVYITTPLKSRS